MSRLSGLDAYLTPPDPLEVDLTDVVCKECKLEQDVVCYTLNDECEWECAECTTLNVTYWDEEPGGFRGWVK